MTTDALICLCRVCKRKLKNPKSIERGVGNICGKKNNIIVEKKEKFINKNHSIFEYI